MIRSTLWNAARLIRLACARSGSSNSDAVSHCGTTPAPASSFTAANLPPRVDGMKLVGSSCIRY